MTQVKRLTILTALIFLFQLSPAQKDLFGTWTVSCLLEKMDIASIQYCNLCPTNSKDDSSIDIKTFEMTVDQSEIKLNMNGEITPVKYKWNEDIQVIEFQYKDTKYSFKMLWGSEKNNRVLKNSDGSLIYLVKK